MSRRIPVQVIWPDGEVDYFTSQDDCIRTYNIWPIQMTRWIRATKEYGQVRRGTFKGCKFVV